MNEPFLHDWLMEATGIPEKELTRERLEAHQLALLRKQLALAKANSAFYAKLYAGHDERKLTSLDDFGTWPQTTPTDLKNHNDAFLCTSQSKVWRIITLQTSGTTGLPKRLFFSENDMRRTVRYFHYSLKELAKDCRNLLVLMPGNVPGSVGDVLRQALEDLPTRCHEYGIVTDFAATLDYIKSHAIDFIIGIPSQVLNLCRYSMQHGGLEQIKAVLFGADYISPFCAETIEKLWSCTTIKHYGSTESALGAAVNCPARTGCHIREADLLFEVVDPITKQPLPNDTIGELVITSLNYDCMPLLRYNTGDLGAISKKPCQCGSVLKRLTQMRPRNTVKLEDDIDLDINELDSLLYQLDGLEYFEADLRHDQAGVPLLEIKLDAAISGQMHEPVLQALNSMAAIQPLIAQNRLKIKITGCPDFKLGNPYVLKRKINDLRNP